MDAAAALFKAGKVKAIIVSGDNGSKGYDEPTMMRDDLIARGVPMEYITLDYAGFRTLDSIVRAEAIFDLEDYIIVSQKFHLERAIYIAHQKGQKVIGFSAKAFENTIWAKRMQHRELLARAKAFLDLKILGKEPKFYGRKERVNYKP
jgi:SanA protein